MMSLNEVTGQRVNVPGRGQTLGGVRQMDDNTSFVCCDCGEDISDRRRNAKRCGACSKQRTRVSNKTTASAFYNENQEHCIERIKTRWLSLPKEERVRQTRIQTLRLKWGMTLDQYDTMLASQDGVCAICRRIETQLWRGSVVMYCVDHDHSCCPGIKSCGRCIRALLCHKCNSGLGMFDDNLDFVKSAVAYLEAHDMVAA